MGLPNSGNSGTGVVMRLRAHHICCVPFWTGTPEGRGSSFQQVENKIKRMFLSPADSKVIVIEGVDVLCRECPLCADESCTSPEGGEDAVRKWDAILLKELGVTFNTGLTCGQWHNLIEQKVPFKICQKCRWKKGCSVGSSLL